MLEGAWEMQERLVSTGTDLQRVHWWFDMAVDELAMLLKLKRQVTMTLRHAQDYQLSTMYALRSVGWSM